MIKKSLYFIWFVALIIGFANFVGQAQATAGNFSIVYAGQLGPLFDHTIISPTETITKTIAVTNNSTTAERFALELNNFIPSQDSLFNQNLTIKISRAGNELYNHILSQAIGAQIVEIIPAGQTFDYDVSATLANVDNTFQGLTTQFDAIVGFWRSGGSSSDEEGGLGGEESINENVISGGQNILGQANGTVIGNQEEARIATPIETPKDIAGAEDQKTPWWQHWWLIILGIILGFWLGLLLARRRRKDK